MVRDVPRACIMRIMRIVSRASCACFFLNHAMSHAEIKFYPIKIKSERNWSTFSYYYIHDKKRNKLTNDRVFKLVYIYFNNKLKNPKTNKVIDVGEDISVIDDSDDDDGNDDSDDAVDDSDDAVDDSDNDSDNENDEELSDN